MTNAAVPPPALPPGGLPDPALDLAPSSGLPFGKVLARIARIPLRRWKTSLVICALSGVVAFLAGKSFSQTSYTAEGKLLYRPAALPDNLKNIFNPLTKQTVRDLIKTTQAHYETLAKEFAPSLPPQTLNQMFSVDEKVQEESEVIGVSLEWGDADQGARMVNRLMELLSAQVKVLRRDEVGKALIGNEEARKQGKDSLQDAKNAHLAFLVEKRVSEPQVERARRRGDHEALLKEYDAVLSRQKTREEQVRELEDKVASLLKRQEEVLANGSEGDEEYRKNKRDLEQFLAEVETKLSEDTRKLNSSRGKVKDIEDLVKARIKLMSELEALQSEIKVLEGSVKNLGTRALALKADLKQNKPHSAEIRRHLTKIEGLKDELIEIKIEVSQKAEKQKVAGEALARAEKVAAEEIPKLNEIQQAEKTYQELTARAQELRNLLDDLRSEIVINTSATPALYPKSNRKKVMAVGFLIPALCLFGIMIAFETASKAWRVESLANDLNLPILARYIASEAEVTGGESNATECRGLSLRLRQYVPDSGAVILFSSLNERNGVEGLMADLIGYFALRDEKVLILDARIANEQADEIQRAIGRAATLRPIEVSPGSDSLTVTPGTRRGLVQYLVFEGQNPWDLAVPTRTQAVDYFPAGGPFPVTDALASEPMKDLLEACRKKYSLILIVGPSVSKSIDIEILSAYVNGVVLVLNEPLNSFVPETRSFFQSLVEANVPLLGAVPCV